jgi:hypothetical protein
MSDSVAPETRPNRSSLLLGVVAVLSVVAIALAAWALLRPAPKTPEPPSATPAYSDMQAPQAKTQICSAFNTVRQGVARNTNMQAPGGEGDIAGTLGVAANARISLFDGGQYLLARLAPSTPTELADAVRAFGNGLLDIGAATTAGAQNTDPDQAKRLADADALSKKIDQLCA